MLYTTHMLLFMPFTKLKMVAEPMSSTGVLKVLQDFYQGTAKPHPTTLNLSRLLKHKHELN